MEQTPQVGSSDAGAAPAAGNTEQGVGEGALREELVKWRGRVPKLAAALRQRAEEVEALKQELARLRRLQGAGDSAPAGIRARDELIAELESGLAELSGRHRDAQGALHSRQVEVEELRAQVAGWKERWQSTVRSADRLSAEADEREQRSRELADENESLRRRLADQEAAHQAGRQALEEAEQERDSLRRRNEQLFETTELANRQIGSLTDSLAELRATLNEQREREAAVNAERENATQELESLRARLAEAEADVQRQVEELHMLGVAAASGANAGARADARVAEAERAGRAAEAALEEARAERAALEGSLEEQRREVERLTGVVELAQRTTGEREDERRSLSEKLQTLEARNRHLEQQLDERSRLVVNLEQDQGGIRERCEALQQERDEFEEALMRAERHVKENADYIAQLDGKLERQKELMENLEQELAEAREEHAQTRKDRPVEPADADAEAERLKEHVRKLETLLRERTDALNRLQWQSEVSGARSQSRDGTDEDEPAEREDREKLLMVLNQQLRESRTRNEELLARLRALEGRSGGAGRQAPDDDLTRIHGVGDKLAEQLNDLGICRYQQIADLDQSDLEDENHVLHPHRGRILRDGWIEQAMRLIRH